MAAVEMYYTVGEVSLLLRLHERTVRERIHAREFGAGVVNLGGERADYRIPASGINAYLDRRRIFVEDEPGIVGRSIGELRRKVSAMGG